MPGDEALSLLIFYYKLDDLKGLFVFRVLTLKKGFEGSTCILIGGALWILPMSVEDFAHMEGDS